MDLWQGILIVLGCIVIGSLVGLLLLRLLRQKKEKKNSLLNQEAKSIKPKNTEVTIATTFSNGIAGSNGHEDPLEILLKNHKNGIVAEKVTRPNAADIPIALEIASQKNTPVIEKEKKLPQPNVTDIPAGVETADQKNPPVIEKQEKPPQRVIHWTELYPPINQLAGNENQKPLEPPVLKEPVAVNQKGTLLEGEPEKTTAPGILQKSEILIDKTAPVEEKRKKVFKSSVSKKSEFVIRKNTPAVKDKKTDTKPLVQEPTNNEPKIAPAVEKREGPLKSDLIIEIEANLVIASKPWSDKLISFHTKCWDSKHGESDLFLNTHYQELIQLYVDIGLANNIAWLATEINHRSKELDESYIKLCSNIVYTIKRILL